MSENPEGKKTIICEACQKEILVSMTLAHLVDHVAKQYRDAYDDETESFTGVNSGQIHDLIVGHYNDEDLHLTNAIDIIEDITDRFDRVRIRIVYKYAPLNIYLLHSKDEGYYVFNGDRERDEFGFDLRNGIAGFINTVNQILKSSLRTRCSTRSGSVSVRLHPDPPIPAFGDNQYTIEVIEKPTNKCQLVSYHVKVPGDWLGVPVAVQKKTGTEIHLTHPVRCGNSVHVTVPRKWSRREVVVTLAPLDHISDLRKVVDDEISG